MKDKKLPSATAPVEPKKLSDKSAPASAPKASDAAKATGKTAAAKTAATSETGAPLKAAKPAKSVKPAKDAKVAKETKAEKKPKQKVVRDSFTMPQSEYQKIAELKALCLESGLSVKKSEVLRAGLKLLSQMNLDQIKVALGGLDKIKTGRPNKH